MTDAEIESKLQGLKVIHTPDHEVRNDIIRVESDRLFVKSSKPGSKERLIRYSTLRAKKRPPTSRNVFALQKELGMPCSW